MNTYSVSELCQNAKILLEDHFPDIWVKGEISNLARPSSGHIYFSLKDDFSQLRCAMFRTHNLRLKFLPENGDEVLVHGRLSLYTNRGDFQLICDEMEPVGLGALQQAYEQLKQKLQKEGLFDSDRKKIIPKYPVNIGVITSRSGAAIRDILKTIHRRYQPVNVIVYPSLVQGEEASSQLINQIHIANERNECDVIILARGGGSIEDLWAFNNEELARTIAISRIPIITGIGHENDFTIADFVADLRASTPSAAAETATPDCDELRITIDNVQHQIFTSIRDKIKHEKISLNNLGRRFAIPRMYFSGHHRQLEQYKIQIIQQFKNHVMSEYNHLKEVLLILNRNSPTNRLTEFRHTLERCSEKITQTMQNQLQEKHAILNNLSKQSHNLSPMPTLSRGYSITSKQDSPHHISSIENVFKGDIITSKLYDGIITSKVMQTDKKN